MGQPMVRTQIQLTEEQADVLKRVASEEHVSIAELVRRAVENLIKSRAYVGNEERQRRAIAISGRFRSGASDLSTEHDRHLSEAYGK